MKKMNEKDKISIEVRKVEALEKIAIHLGQIEIYIASIDANLMERM